MKKAEWTRIFAIKAAAFALAAALVPVIMVTAIALACGYENRWWIAQPKNRYDTDIVRGEIYSQMDNAREYYTRFGTAIKDDPSFTTPTQTNYRFAIYDENDTLICDTLSADGVALDLYNPLSGEKGRIESGVAREMKAQDGIYWAVRISDFLYSVFPGALPVLIGSSLFLLFLLVYLACVSGRRVNVDGPVAGWQEKIPFDLYLGLAGLGFLCMAALFMESCEGNFIRAIPLYLALWTVLILGASALLLAAWMTFCTRVKLGAWWRNTITWRVFKLCRCFLKQCLHMLRAAARGFLSLLRNIPIVWKTSLVLAAICLYDLFCLSFCGDTDMLLFFWLLGKAIICPAALYAALMLKKLQACGAALAAGDLASKVDTRHMFGDFRRHGENLNDISLGMQRAVDRQMKSERLKTELITNVSHDIKTPLTSIINYVGLLQRDPTAGQAAEYLAVLDRQSHRLKKLTEDLVEVSKASTGNMAVNPSRCSIRELLKQALGEYSERLEKAGLEAVVTLPEQEVFAWADGTLLWRVLDNLLSNACKYALPGTRLYAESSESNGQVHLSFKNISRQRLNISADELTERFVRGDRSRSGEGSGLGLNIAKSLMELQGGALELFIDGDLFRVNLSLPSVS